MILPFSMLDSTTVASITRFLDYDELEAFDESLCRHPWPRGSWRCMTDLYLLESWLQMDRYLCTLIRETVRASFPEYLAALPAGAFRCYHMWQYLCEVEDEDVFGINGPDEFWWLEMHCHWMQRDFGQEKIELEQRMAQYELEKEQRMVAQYELEKEQELQGLSSLHEEDMQKDSKTSISACGRRTRPSKYQDYQSKKAKTEE
jgi:hypothetical protein